MGLKIEDLSKIEYEFPDIYAELFVSALNRFKQSLKIKNKVIAQIEIVSSDSDSFSEFSQAPQEGGIKRNSSKQSIGKPRKSKSNFNG